MPQAQVHGENGGKTLNSEKSLLVALGSNLTSSIGPPAETLNAALQGLKNYGATIRSVSALYSTPAFPVGNGPDFVNAAADICAPWSPREALDIFHDIEASMGRTRAVRWGQRTLDLDLIACGDLVLPDAKTHAEWRKLPLEAQVEQVPDRLILPHPRLQERAFVLVPLADVAPEWVHPVLKLSVSQMLAGLDRDAKQQVRRLQ